MSDNLVIVVTEEPGVTVLVLAGDLDLNTVRMLDRVVGEARAAGGGVTLDLARLGFVDSTGLAALLRANARVVADGHELRLRGVTERLWRLLQMTATESLFPIEP
jgi:anti-sigma B factor antagonist